MRSQDLEGQVFPEVRPHLTRVDESYKPPEMVMVVVSERMSIEEEQLPSFFFTAVDPLHSTPAPLGRKLDSSISDTYIPAQPKSLQITSGATSCSVDDVRGNSMLLCSETVVGRTGVRDIDPRNP